MVISTILGYKRFISTDVKEEIKSITQIIKVIMRDGRHANICISNVTWLLNPASKLGFMYYIGEQLNWAYSCDLNLIWLPNPIPSLILKISYILQWFSVSYLPIFPTLHQRLFIPCTSRRTCQPDCMDSVPPCDVVGSWFTKKFPSHNLFKVYNHAYYCANGLIASITDCS